ncbi:MEMO1 family [Haematococcus lacustris]
MRAVVQELTSEAAMPKLSRAPTHADSWYEADSAKLSKQVEQWLAAAGQEAAPSPRAIIAPHAGHRYCGHIMAHAFKNVDITKVSRVFLLGPSHHVHTRRCCLSPATAYDTPLGSLTIDQEVYRVLQGTGAFDTMDISTDEAEHSLELLTPFIAFLVAGRPVRLVPIMVGSLSTDSEALYGSLLGPYLDDPSNLFVISSDFCHWGRRFSYTFHDTTQGPIWKSIQWLDETGMKAIETGQPTAFSQYLSKYGNTICGRHPIGVLLNMLQHAATLFNVKFVKYDQSSRCERMNDSSVSYAAATVLPAV